MDYEEIVEEYEYDGVLFKTSVLFFPEKNIATVVDRSFEPKILTIGMDYKDVLKYFPLKSGQYNLRKLIRSIIYEAFIKEGLELEEGNVRGFWYTHLKHIITKILGLGETDSVLSTINQAWGEMINSGMVTYEGMNIEGGKEIFRESHVKDSPFNNLIVAVEKESFFTKFKWIPMLFNCTLITAGGQPSRAVARGFIKQLKDLGTNMDQDFYMCVASDLDPAGYYIQEAFRKQLESAIIYYGGNGTIEIKRLFVRKDQVSDDLLKYQAVPCRDKAKSVQAMKSEETKWQYFSEQTDGGLYLSKPSDWVEYEVYTEGKGKKKKYKVRGDGPVYDIDGQPMVRGLLEMDAFSKKIIERVVIEELLRIIKETSDESKIMIPEIMRIFELMRDESIDEVYQDWREKLIEPLISRFLEDTYEWEREIRYRHKNDLKEAEDHRDEESEQIEYEYNLLINEQKNLCREREPELHETRDRLTRAIRKLLDRRRKVIKAIKFKCRDICEEIELINMELNEWLESINTEFKGKKKELEYIREFRRSKLRDFKDENSTIFNPMEMQLKYEIAQTLDKDVVIYYFKQIEKMDQFRKHIARLLTDPELLLEDDVSCFEQPVPTFTEEDLLVKAAELSDKNIERVRNAFPKAFTDEMKKLIKTHVEEVEFELKGEVEQVDLTEKINLAMEETEKEIELKIEKTEDVDSE